MTSRKCRIGAGVASVLVGSVLFATTAGAQNPPTAQPRTTTGDRSASTPADCQQMTGVDRQECERALSSTPQQTDPNIINSTTRSVPSSSNPPSPEDQEDQEDQDQSHASTGKDRQDADEDADEDENAASASKSQDEQEQAPPDTTSEADSDSDTDSDSQTPPQR